MFDLKNKVAVVTGFTRGIGKAMARAYAQAGAQVVISSRKADACKEVVREFKDAGLSAIDIPCHVDVRINCKRWLMKPSGRWAR